MLINFRYGRRCLKPWRDRKLFFSQELRIEHLRLIPRPVIAKHCYNRVTGTQIAGEADRAGNIDAARTAEAKALFREELEGYIERFRIGNLIGPVDDYAFKVGGDAALADPLRDG